MFCTPPGLRGLQIRIQQDMSCRSLCQTTFWTDSRPRAATFKFLQWDSGAPRGAPVILRRGAGGSHGEYARGPWVPAQEAPSFWPTLGGVQCVSVAILAPAADHHRCSLLFVCACLRTLLVASVCGVRLASVAPALFGSSLSALWGRFNSLCALA